MEMERKGQIHEIVRIFIRRVIWLRIDYNFDIYDAMQGILAEMLSGNDIYHK